MPRLSNEERLRAIGMLEAGMVQRQVARIMGCQQRTISKLIGRYHEKGTVADRPHSGRPKVITPREEHYIRLTHLRDRFRAASQTAAVTIGTHGHAAENVWSSVGGTPTIDIFGFVVFFSIKVCGPCLAC